jgi:hypothetical protein
MNTFIQMDSTIKTLNNKKKETQIQFYKTMVAATFTYRSKIINISKIKIKQEAKI